MNPITINPKVAIASLLLLLVLILVPSWYFYSQYQKALKSNPTVKTLDEQKSNKELIDKVGKLMILPTGETPTVATVSDLAKLKNNPFFAQAKQGDKVLIYLKAKKAILYDPLINKIIDVGPIYIPSTSAKITPVPTVTTPAVSPRLSPTSPPVITLSPASPTPTPILTPLSFVIYNGTLTAGLTQKFAPQIIALVPDALILQKSDAKGNYDESLLIKIKNLEDPRIASLASSLKLKVTSLPSGEIMPAKGDILIILGKDKSNL